MLRKLLALAGLFALASVPAFAETTQAPLKAPGWSFSGPFGMYDQDSAATWLQGLQRGLFASATR